MWSSCSNIFIILQILFTKIAENQLRASTTLASTAQSFGIMFIFIISFFISPKSFKTLKKSSISHCQSLFNYKSSSLPFKSYTSFKPPHQPGSPLRPSFLDWESNPCLTDLSCSLKALGWICVAWYPLFPFLLSFFHFFQFCCLDIAFRYPY